MVQRMMVMFQFQIIFADYISEISCVEIKPIFAQKFHVGMLSVKHIGAC